MQTFLCQNIGVTRNEMILEESLSECAIERLLRSRRAIRAAQAGRLQNILASLFGHHPAKGAHQVGSRQPEQTHPT